MGVVYIIKNKIDSNSGGANNQIIANAKDSLESGTIKYYNSKEIDGKNLKQYKENKKDTGVIMMVSYTGTGKASAKEYSKCEIESIYLGNAQLVESNQESTRCNIKYIMKKCIKDKKVIINLLDGLELDLGNDFEDRSYIIINQSKQLVNSLVELMTQTPQANKKSNYSKGENSYTLADFAQHNNQCIRMYGVRKEEIGRSEFQRDRERIVNSKAFRRLVDKAQIFSAEKGDHYRTRMTHTLEVNQIAKAIAGSLNLNIDLTEAIALGHDLGHTPFGHQGERTIRDILFGEKSENLFNIGEKLFTSELLGGFKHNYQSIRVLTKLEEKYVDHAGLDISMQVLEGILKHTGLKDAEIEIFIDEKFIEYLHMDKDFATSLEGQVVAVADEIAQRGHDIDDAITSRMLNIEELIEALSTSKFSEIHEELKKEKDEIDKNKRQYINEKELTIARIISCIVGFFIKDVVENSKEKIKKYKKDYSNGVFDEQLIDFSEVKGKMVCKFLEKVVNKKVISSSEVACFDYNASVVIEKLFVTYYNNPRLLHKGTLRKIYVDQLQHPDPQIADSAVDLSEGNMHIVRKEIEEITKDRIEEIKTCEDYIKLEKRKILIRNIVDYIAGMTDSYAIHEYEKIK